MSDTHKDDSRFDFPSAQPSRWSERAKIGFLMFSTAVTVLMYVNMNAYREAVERNTAEVQRLKEDRDHDYRETMTWKLAGWVGHSRAQDDNIGAYKARLAEITRTCLKTNCNLPDNLLAPVAVKEIEPTDALIMASERIASDAPYGAPNKEQ